MTAKRRANGTFEKDTHWRQRKPHWDKEWLIREYVTNQRSTGEIAAEIGTTDANVLYWMRKHGIERRTVSGARAIKHWALSGPENPMFGKNGELNPNYRDGSSPERQRTYAQGTGRDFIKFVLQRDSYRCRRCNEPNKGRKFLHVHHIAQWSKYPEFRFDPLFAITLCKPCHNWIHSKKNTTKEYLA